MSQPPWALVVEDDRAWQELLKEILTDCGLEVEVSGSLDEAIPLVKSRPHRLAIVDLSLSQEHTNTDGLRLLEIIRRLDPTCHAILLTGFATVELAVRALSEYGAFSFLRKEAFQINTFCELIKHALCAAPPSAPASSSGLEIAPVPSWPDESLSSPDGTVLVIEDDAGWRSLLTELLQESGFRVRACSGFGEALGCLRREIFHLAVIDLSLGKSWAALGETPDVSDLEGYRLLAAARAAGMPTIVVSGVASPEEIQRAYEEQAIFAYLEKQTFDHRSFLQTVNEARSYSHKKDDLSLLSERERQVFSLMAQGLTNKEIAESLVITTNTVKRHLKSIFKKLGVHSRAAAVGRSASRLPSGRIP